MEPDLKTVNDYLVSVFNDILTIEESGAEKISIQRLVDHRNAYDRGNRDV